MAPDVENGGQLLELGCGEGVYSVWYGWAGLDVTAVDFDPLLLKDCKLKTELNGRTIKTKTADAANTNLKSNSFDTILFSEVIEHQISPEPTLKEIYRLLKKDGSAIITTPLRPRQTTRSYTELRNYDQEELKKYDKSTENHVFEFDIQELTALLSKISNSFIINTNIIYYCFITDCFLCDFINGIIKTATVVMLSSQLNQLLFS